MRNNLFWSFFTTVIRVTFSLQVDIDEDTEYEEEEELPEGEDGQFTQHGWSREDKISSTHKHIQYHHPERWAGVVGVK